MNVYGFIILITYTLPGGVVGTKAETRLFDYRYGCQVIARLTDARFKAEGKNLTNKVLNQECPLIKIIPVPKEFQK